MTAVLEDERLRTVYRRPGRGTERREAIRASAGARRRRSHEREA